MKAFVTIACLVLLPVLLESCGEFWDRCDSGNFTIENFTVQVVKADKPVYEPAPASGKPAIYLFVLGTDRRIVMNESRATMGAYADCMPTSSVETITQFELTSDHDLVLPDRTLMATSNLTSVIQYEYSDTDSFMNRDLYPEDFRFYPKFTVPSAQTHQFTFSMTLSDGRKFDIKTPVIELLPE